MNLTTAGTSYKWNYAVFLLLKIWNTSQICMPFLCRCHANHCMVPILVCAIEVSTLILTLLTVQNVEILLLTTHITGLEMISIYFPGCTLPHLFNS